MEKNLTSVFSQKYENYRLIYIDDSSRDDTLKKASELLIKLDMKGCATLIHNSSNCGSLANIYNAVHSCHDHEIIIMLDGDDFLAHENVLSTLNQTYADHDIWLTYGNYLDYPSFKQEPHICKKLSDKVITKSLFRKSPWVTSHLRSFYAGLFKQIKLEDLFYRGRFYSMSGDLAFMFPMLELAKNHIHFIEDTLYLYNRQNPISDHKINIDFQQECANHIRSKPRYSALNTLPSQYSTSKKTGDLLIFSQDRPLQLYAFLESVQRYVTGLNKISVLYEASTTAFESAYLDLRLTFPSIHFVQKKTDFKPLLISLLFHSMPPESEHILFAHDQLVIKDIVDITKGIQTLDQTEAYGIFYAHHENLKYSKELNRYQPIPPHNPLRGLSSGEVPFAWQFSAGTDDWNTPNSFHFALYRKQSLNKLFNKLDYDSPSSLSYEWGIHCPQEAIGLFYRNGKCAQITPLKDFSSLAFLEKFHDGLKIDITPYFQLTSPSQEITTSISFISRD